ncbi:MAG TPA: RcnB family protein [Micropepsaceae bacterium]|nr:RcnB family protein [Micropepsaceae bacterium]
MKRLLSSVFAIAVITALPALAAPSDFSYRQLAQRDDDRRGDRGRDNRDRDRGRGRGDERRVEHGPPQFEQRAFERNFDAPRRFRIERFRPPPGWRYRRWVYGDILPPAYWARPFWIGSFWLYDLDRPPLGYEWVRSGPDALLVDTVTGRILRVEYNVFY